ncbi:MAG: hypothetical protein ACRBI6_07210 [Acidimicrobiales bacterium]
MIDLTDLTDRIDVRRCQQWLRDARGRTADGAVHRLIDDVADELRMVAAFAGGVADDMTDVVIGALASVEAAVEVAALSKR